MRNLCIDAEKQKESEEKEKRVEKKMINWGKTNKKGNLQLGGLSRRWSGPSRFFLQTKTEPMKKG
jgi:hypothetical protein